MNSEKSLYKRKEVKTRIKERLLDYVAISVWLIALVILLTRIFK